MNRRELIIEISKRTNVSVSDCDDVIRTFEKLLTEALSDKKWKCRTFDFIGRIVNAIKKR